jgi:hypothetical protein
MQFVFFIASTMLIVLISQQSTMGLPVKDKEMEKPCLEGMKMIDGKCMPISTKSSKDEIKSPLPNEDRITKDPIRKEEPCAEGLKRGKDGLCEPFSTEKVVPEPKPISKLDPVRKEEPCAEGLQRGKDGLCEPFSTGRIVPEPKPISKLVTVRKEEPCAEGLEHGKDGLCEPTSSPTAATETKPIKKLDPVRKFGACSEGMQHGEHGICQPIESFKNKETERKESFKKVRPCPEGYEMINSKCFYLKSKLTTPSPSARSSGELDRSGRPKAKSVNDESFVYEKVPVNADNSCPEGTEYSDFGTCQKRIPSSRKFGMKSDGGCPANFEFIDGKCKLRNSKVKVEPRVPTTTTTDSSLDKPEPTTTRPAERIDNDKLPESFTTPKSDIETSTVEKKASGDKQKILLA